MTNTLKAALSASCVIALFACSPSASPPADDAEGTAAAPSTSRGSASPSANTATPSSTPIASASASASPSKQTAAPLVPEQVPLTPGVYVLAGTTCANPANAAWRVWDGRGLSGSSTKACRATITAKRGDTYTLRNSCEDTYDGSRTDETLAMTVTDQVHFSVKGQAFESCSMAQVPQELRRRVTG